MWLRISQNDTRYPSPGDYFFNNCSGFLGRMRGAIDNCNEVKFPAVPKGLQSYAPVSRKADKNYGAVMACNTLAVPT